MAWYWIVLLVLAALLLLLCMTRVGARIAFGPEGITLRVKIGLLSLQILPPRKKKERAEKKGKKSKAKAPQNKDSSAKEKKKAPKFTLEDIKSAVKTLWPSLKRALHRTRRGIKVDPLQLSVTVGAENDPAAGAELYGYLHGGVWTGMPVLEQLLDIPDPRIHVGIDFDEAKMKAEGTAGISIRIGTVLAVALGVGIPALRWFLRFQKKKKQQTGAAPATKEGTGHTAA